MNLKDILSWFLGLVALALYPQRRVGNSSRGDSSQPNSSNPGQKSGQREKNFDRDEDERQSTQASHISLLEEEIAKLRSSLERVTQESTHYEKEYVRFKQLYKDQRASKEAIDQQLQRVEEEYASLRSHYQLQNCMEKKDIVQGLEDLNVKIRGLSQAISKKLIKDIRAEGGSVASMTTLNAFNYSQLESFFQAKGEGHSTHSSLVKSKEGAGRGLVNFFDFAIRTSLCTILVEFVFKPFCPSVNQSAPGCACLDIVYQEVQKQESQYMAGQWRSITFKSACELEGPETLDERINRISHDILRISLDPLVTYFLGQNVEDELSQYAARCNQLVRMAWDWGSKLKREVIMIGEFEQIAFGHCTQFDPSSMEELDPKAGSVPPKCILGTVGLGLVLRQSIGEGRPPEETIVCKAKVVTDSFYGQT